jgi:hypothetical protein
VSCGRWARSAGSEALGRTHNLDVGQPHRSFRRRGSGVPSGPGGHRLSILLVLPSSGTSMALLARWMRR